MVKQQLLLDGQRHLCRTKHYLQLLLSCARVTAESHTTRGYIFQQYRRVLRPFSRPRLAQQKSR